ncbi:hypothetical protein JCM10213v2_002478 [Rhodosporidiobolus nylandii]
MSGTSASFLPLHGQGHTIPLDDLETDSTTDAMEGKRLPVHKDGQVSLDLGEVNKLEVLCDLLKGKKTRVFSKNRALAAAQYKNPVLSLVEGILTIDPTGQGIALANTIVPPVLAGLVDIINSIDLENKEEAASKAVKQKQELLRQLRVEVVEEVLSLTQNDREHLLESVLQIAKRLDEQTLEQTEAQRTATTALDAAIATLRGETDVALSELAAGCAMHNAACTARLDAAARTINTLLVRMDRVERELAAMHRRPVCDHCDFMVCVTDASPL